MVICAAAYAQCTPIINFFFSNAHVLHSNSLIIGRNDLFYLVENIEYHITSKRPFAEAYALETNLMNAIRK